MPLARRQRRGSPEHEPRRSELGDRWTPSADTPDGDQPDEAHETGEQRTPDATTALLARSKRELYERARQLGIAGRSALSKTGLARAIARRTRGGGMR